MRKTILLIAALSIDLFSQPAYAFVRPTPVAMETIQSEPERFQQWKARLIQKAIEKKAAKKVSGEAIVSFGAALLLGLAAGSSVGSLTLWPLLALAACVLGILALRKIKKNPGMGGRLLALLGLFIGSLGIILVILLLIGLSGQ